MAWREEEDEEGFDQLDQISQVALLIDDLTNEDPLASQNSIEKLDLISSTLGKQRTVDELIPMLTDLIDKIDANSNLLLKLAEKLGDLCEFLGEENSISLTQPLEIIAGTDDNIVRQKAVESLQKVWEQSKTQHKQQFSELITRLAEGDLYSSRIAVCGLIPDAVKDQELQSGMEELYYKLAKDDTPMVRRAAANAFGSFIENIKEINDQVIEVYKTFLKDAQDAVKTEAIKNSVVLTKLLMDHEQYQFEHTMVTAIEEAMSHSKGSWRLRYAIAEVLPQISNIVGKEHSDDHLVSMLEKLLEDSEAEVRSAAIDAIAEIGKVVDPKLIIEKFVVPISVNIVNDSSVHVRASLAEGICKVSEFVSSQDCVDRIVPIILQLIKDQHSDVRLTLLTHIGIVTKAIGKVPTEEMIIPAIQDLCKEKQWRIRYSTLQFFPKMAEMMDTDLFKDKLQNVLLETFTDTCFKIRERSIENIIQIKESFGKDWFEAVLMEQFKKYSESEKCHFRIQAI